jgi:choline dehydrogenase-like flavoprotein
MLTLIPDHGTSGPLHVSYADIWEKNIGDVFVAAEQVGLGTNPDINSGNPIGMGIGASTVYKGSRITSSAYLLGVPSNLTIMTATPVTKVLISGKTATGVLTADGTQFIATKDVILSGGAINSPQLLMLSGIGPADQLKNHGISVVHDLPFVGKNLQDHCFSTATLLQKEGTNDRMAYETDDSVKAAAKEQFEKDRTGPLSQLYCGNPMGWFKNENVFKSPEFAALPKNTQELLLKPTVPIFEIATVGHHLSFCFLLWKTRI